MRRRVVCPRSHPASLYAWRPSGAFAVARYTFSGGYPPPDPPVALCSARLAMPGVRLAGHEVSWGGGPEWSTFCRELLFTAQAHPGRFGSWTRARSKPGAGDRAAGVRRQPAPGEAATVPGSPPPAHHITPLTWAIHAHDYSGFRNPKIATTSIPAPITATSPSDTPSGTGQPAQVTAGASWCTACGLTVRWLNTARRIGSTM